MKVDISKHLESSLIYKWTGNSNDIRFDVLDGCFSFLCDQRSTCSQSEHTLQHRVQCTTFTDHSTCADQIDSIIKRYANDGCVCILLAIDCWAQLSFHSNDGCRSQFQHVHAYASIDASQCIIQQFFSHSLFVCQHWKQLRLFRRSGKKETRKNDMSLSFC